MTLRPLVKDQGRASRASAFAGECLAYTDFSNKQHAFQHVGSLASAGLFSWVSLLQLWLKRRISAAGHGDWGPVSMPLVTREDVEAKTSTICGASFGDPH